MQRNETEVNTFVKLRNNTIFRHIVTSEEIFCFCSLHAHQNLQLQNSSRSQTPCGVVIQLNHWITINLCPQCPCADKILLVGLGWHLCTCPWNWAKIILDVFVKWAGNVLESIVACVFGINRLIKKWNHWYHDSLGRWELNIRQQRRQCQVVLHSAKEGANQSRNIRSHNQK